MSFFMHTDFASGWLSADASGDKFMKKELVLNKLGEVLVKDKAEIVKLLARRGVKITVDTPQDKYLEEVFTQSARSEDFVKEITKLTMKDSIFSNSFGDYLSSPQAAQNASDITSLILHFLTKKKSDVKDSVERQKWSSQVVTAKTATWFFGAVIFAGIAAVAWLYFNKNKSETSNISANVGNSSGFTSQGGAY